MDQERGQLPRAVSREVPMNQRSYKLQFASDIVRDGLGVELIDEGFNVHAEVFRCDKDHTVVFSAFSKDIPFAQIERLIAVARAELPPFEDGMLFSNRLGL
jgi:hypothetical protein